MKNTKHFNPLYGVNGGPGAFWPDIAGPSRGFVDVIRQYQKIGVRGIRFHDYFGAGDMTQYFPLDGSGKLPDPKDENNYYWEETDRQFSKIIKGGFAYQLQLGQGWRNMASWAPFPEMELEGYQLNPENPTRFWPNFNEISRKLAPDLFIKFLDHIWTKWEIEPDENCYVEFWNEPNIQTINTVPLCPDLLRCSDEEFVNTTFRNYEWDGTPLEFYQLFEVYAKSIKERYPKVKIGGPALWNPGANPTQYPCNQRWIELFFNYVKQYNVPMDFICWTLYTDNPEDFETNYTIIQSHLDRIGYTQTQQIISEYAINFGNKTTLPDGTVMPNSLLAKGAAIATSLWIGLQEFDNLKMAYYYRGNDGPFVPDGAGFPIMLTKDGDTITNPNPSNFGPAGVGMFHGNGKRKPVARAFKLWSKMADLIRLNPDDYVTSRVPYDGKLYLLAGENDDKDLIILGSYRNDLSTLKASFSIKDTRAKGAVMETVLDNKVNREKIHDLQNIWVQPNRAFLITVLR